MGEDVKSYIDKKVSNFSQEIKRDLKWAVGLILGALLVVLGWMGTATIKNRMYIQDLEYDMAIMNARTKTLEFKILWMAEVSELVKEYYKTDAGSEKAIDFLEQAKRMEERIMSLDQPMPSLRSGYYKDDK